MKRAARIATFALCAAIPIRVSLAQTAYYDLDATRPVRIEDANVVDLYAIELEPAPVRAEWLAGGRSRYRVSPHFAFGILPRTQVEASLPLERRDLGAGPESGAAGLELSAMHSFNNEREHRPAFALWIGARVPVGALAARGTRVGARGIMTRSFGFGRVHLNAEYSTTNKSSPCQPVAGATSCTAVNDGHLCSIGEHGGALRPTLSACMAAQSSAPAPAPLTPPRGRWGAGVAADHALPLRSLLLVAGVFAQRDARQGAPNDWTAETGLRWQLGPSSVFDVGVGRHFTGADRSFSLTTGLAFELAAPGFLGR